MSNTRFLHTNYLEASAAVLVEDPPTTGGTVRDEATGYVLENVTLADRRSLWKITGATGLDVIFDLTGAASNKSVTAAALLGHRAAVPGQTGIVSCDVYTAPHTGGGFAAAVFTSQGTISLNGDRDGGIVFAAAATRWLLFTIVCSQNFTLGRMWASTTDIDLGQVYAPGARRQYVLPHVDADTIGGEKVRTYLGDKYILAQIPFETLDATTRAKLVTLAGKRQSVVYVDHNDVFREVHIEFEETHTWQATNPLYDGMLNVVQLG